MKTESKRKTELREMFVEGVKTAIEHMGRLQSRLEVEGYEEEARGVSLAIKSLTSTLKGM